MRYAGEPVLKYSDHIHPDSANVISSKQIMLILIMFVSSGGLSFCKKIHLKCVKLMPGEKLL